jgi:hypothetical protein
VCAAAARSCDVTREMPVRVSGLGARCRHTRLASCPLSVTLTRRVTVGDATACSAVRRCCVHSWKCKT